MLEKNSATFIQALSFCLIIVQLQLQMQIDYMSVYFCWRCSRGGPKCACPRGGRKCPLKDSTNTRAQYSFSFTLSSIESTVDNNKKHLKSKQFYRHYIVHIRLLFFFDMCMFLGSVRKRVASDALCVSRMNLLFLKKNSI